MDKASVNEYWRDRLEPGDCVQYKEMNVTVWDTYAGKYGMRYKIHFNDSHKVEWVFGTELDVSCGSILREATNKYGFKNMYDVLNDPNCRMPVCATCGVFVLPNRGSGMICDSCEHAFNVHCEADYY